MQSVEVKRCKCAESILGWYTECASEQEGCGVEEVWRGFKCGLLETADKVCGQIKGRPKHRETWWWNDEVEQVVEEKRRHFKVWQK